MKRTKILALMATAAFFSSFATAQDMDFGDDFGSDFGGDFGDSASSSSFAATALSVNGEAQVNFRAYVDDEGTSGLPIDEWNTWVDPKGKLGLNYSNDSVSADVKFALSKDIITDYKADIIDELTLEAYLGNFVIQAGKMKVVWGKGDKLHVIDNFNANDYKDFLIPDYIDRRISEPMVRVLYNAPNDAGPFTSNRFEFVWTPFMTADRYAASGRWIPTQVKGLEKKLKGIATDSISSTVKDLEENRTKLAVAQTGLTNAKNAYEATEDETEKAKYAAQMQDCGNAVQEANENLTALNTAYLSQLNNSSSLADNLYPDLYQLKYMQAGARFTTTTGSWDWGLSYYFGRDKRASFDFKNDYKKMADYVQKYLKGTAEEDDKFIDYDFLQVFGIEAAKTFGAYNFRAEAAYNLTKDVAGDDPKVHNNSVAWVFGFDRDLPVSELNFNLQTQGKFILNHDEIKDSSDTESGTYKTDNKLVLNISDNLAHGKLKPEVSAIYGFEHFDLIIMPKVTWYVSDGLEFSASGMYMQSFIESRSEFGNWHNNSFVQIAAKYTF